MGMPLSSFSGATLKLLGIFIPSLLSTPKQRYHFRETQMRNVKVGKKVEYQIVNVGKGGDKGLVQVGKIRTHHLRQSFQY